MGIVMNLFICDWAFSSFIWKCLCKKDNDIKTVGVCTVGTLTYNDLRSKLDILEHYKDIQTFLIKNSNYKEVLLSIFLECGKKIWSNNN